MSDDLIGFLIALSMVPVFLFFWCRSINRRDAEFCERQRAKERRIERNSTAFWK